MNHLPSCGGFAREPPTAGARSTCLRKGGVKMDLAIASVAVLLEWDGATGNWSTATNWNPDQEPTATDKAAINNGGTAWITLPGEVCDSLWLGEGLGRRVVIGVGGAFRRIGVDVRWAGHQQSLTPDAHR